jgi:hypothetical protein
MEQVSKFVLTTCAVIPHDIADVTSADSTTRGVVYVTGHVISTLLIGVTDAAFSGTCNTSYVAVELRPIII